VEEKEGVSTSTDQTPQMNKKTQTKRLFENERTQKIIHFYSGHSHFKTNASKTHAEKKSAFSSIQETYVYVKIALVLEIEDRQEGGYAYDFVCVT